MNNRTVIIGIGLALIAATALFAPFRFYGHTGIIDPRPATGTIHRPMFGGAPKAGALESLPVDPDGTENLVFLSAVELDTGKLALWWFGIALCAGAALLLLGKTTPAERRLKSDPTS